MKYRRHHPVLFIVLTCMAVLFLSRTSFSEGKDGSDQIQTFTIASYNINYGNPDLPGVVETLRKANADIVALQEINHTSQRYLLRKLRRQYPYSAFHYAPAAGGFGFLSKTPLRNVKHHPLRVGWFGAYVTETTLDGRDVRIVNLHLQPTLPEYGESLFRFLLRWRKTALTRVREIQQVLSELPDDTRNNLILVGDFNSLPGGIVTQTLRNMGFVDGYASVTPEPRRGTTWQWQVGEHLVKLRLDYCFHGLGFQTRRSLILRSDASDHHLILNTLQRQSIDKK